MKNTVRISQSKPEHWAMYPTNRIVNHLNAVIKRDQGNTLLRLMRIAARKDHLKTLLCVMDNDIYESDITLPEFEQFWITTVTVGGHSPTSFNDTIRLIIDNNKA